MINLSLIRTITLDGNCINILWNTPHVDGNMFWFRTYPITQKLKFDTANEANTIYSEIVSRLT